MYKVPTGAAKTASLLPSLARLDERVTLISGTDIQEAAMVRLRLAGCILGGLACVFTLAIRAQQRVKPIEVPTPIRIQPLGISASDLQAPLTVVQPSVNLIGVIAVPGSRWRVIW